jgi:L-iditol 2-dehydrogenase
MKNRCAYLDANHRFTIKEEPIPKPKKNEVLIKIAVNGICGSDIHFYHEGRLGEYRVTVPYVPGHECSGIIVDTGDSVDKSRKGEHVAVEPGISCGKCYYCKTGRYNICEKRIFLSAPPINGTLCDYLTIREDLAHPVPKDMDLRHAALAEPSAIAVHAVSMAKLKYNSTGVILGAGPIGLLTGKAFKAAGGGKLIIIDILEERLEFAKKIGADEIIQFGSSKIDGPDLENIGDIVFETAGSPAATSILFSIAKPGANIVQIGWPAGNNVNMNIAKLIEKELHYFGSMQYANSYPTAIQWLYEGKIDAEKFITKSFDFNQIEEAFEYSYSNPKKILKVIVMN